MRRTTKQIIVALLVTVAVLLSAPVVGAAASESVSGTLPGYQTTVERSTEGDLSEENLRQSSLLGSQLLLHVTSAIHDVEDRSPKTAAVQIDKGLALIGFIREMLPVTEETTVVKDPSGKEVYRHTERSQDDLIPIYQEMTAVEVVRSVLDVRWNHAAVDGVQLEDVDVVHTSVLVDLSYVERRLRKAKSMLQTPEKALEQLQFAYVRGVRFSVDKKNDPLLDAQRALRLAERMAEEKNYKAAKANLLVARNHLTLYRGLVPEENKASIRDLQAEIQRLEGGLDEQSAGTIRSAWQRVTGWMAEEPGQATLNQTSDTKTKGTAS